MTSTNADQNLLKTDARGRVRVSRESRAALLAEFAASGLSAARFARLAGINYTTFAGWVQKRRREPLPSTAAAESASGEPTQQPASKRLRLFEAVVDHSRMPGAEAQSGNPAGLLVELPGGARLAVESPLQLRLAAELLALLAQTTRRPC
jgi:transposase-like protein